MLNKKVKELIDKLVEEASLAKTMVKKSLEGLLKKDKGLLKEVIGKDEPNMNKMELDMDEFCISLIARYQPEAGYLRTILMSLKINNDLERIGDLAVNIAESASYLIERPMVKPLIDIPRMGEEAIGMLDDAIKAFVEKDADLARSVCERDEVVDSLKDQVLRELVTYMAQDPSTIDRSIHLIRISRNLERIGDLSTNVSEDVVYMVEGKVIKHRKDKI